MRLFLGSSAFLTSAMKEDDPNFLTACLKELRQAKDKGHLDASNGFSSENLAEELKPFARFDDPEALLGAECTIVKQIAEELTRLGFHRLGRLLAATPTRGQPLLATAVQYYFRREVGEDPELARELTWVKQVNIEKRVNEGFDSLTQIQQQFGKLLEEALEGQARVEVVVIETRDAVLTLHEDFSRLMEQFELLRRYLTARHSVSYRDEHERALILAVKRRYRDLTEGQREKFPQLELDLSELEIVAGEYQAALEGARASASRLDGDTSSKAAAHHAAYRAALELRKWDEALVEINQAAAADSRFAVWPTAKHRVERILGAGAFGVAFLCRDTYTNRLVVIKTFELAGVDRDAATVFIEAQIIASLRNDGIVMLYSCGFVDEARKQRPYLELEHFSESVSLEDHVNKNGKMTPDEFMPIAVRIAEALKAAHDANVLHRDVKPGNVLVRKSARGWEAKLIDFGLSLRRSLVESSKARAAVAGRSIVGSAVAGTLHYAAPEQLDPDRSGELGPHSDVFGFGRTCLFGLFKTTQPRSRDIRAMPRALARPFGRLLRS